jgi:hypothetical protein
MADVWIVLIEDRHSDVDARPFSSEEAAIAVARSLVPDSAEEEPLNDAERQDGWLLLLIYGTEGDRVRVIRRSLE